MTPADLQKYLDAISNMDMSSFIFLVLAAGAFVTLVSEIIIRANTGFGEQDIIILGLCVTVITAALGHVQSNAGQQQINQTISNTQQLLESVIFCNKPDNVECQYASPPTQIIKPK